MKGTDAGTTACFGFLGFFTSRLPRTWPFAILCLPVAPASQSWQLRCGLQLSRYGVSTVHEAMGRLRERHSRVARYYVITYDSKAQSVTWQENADKKEKAQTLDGSYLLMTDRHDLTHEDIWRTYLLLTRVEAAFRSMKSPLMERPIFHQIQRRVQTHIFLCVLAYHLLVAIEKMFLDAGVHTSWWTLRQQLSTHQVVTVVLPASNGKTLRIRKGSTAEDVHREIYGTLRIPEQVMKPVKTWAPPQSP